MAVARCSPFASPELPLTDRNVLLDGTLPHDAESIGPGPARLLFVDPRGQSELTRRD